MYRQTSESFVYTLKTNTEESNVVINPKNIYSIISGWSTIGYTYNNIFRNVTSLNKNHFLRTLNATKVLRDSQDGESIRLTDINPLSNTIQNKITEQNHINTLTPFLSRSLEKTAFPSNSWVRFSRKGFQGSGGPPCATEPNEQSEASMPNHPMAMADKNPKQKTLIYRVDLILGSFIIETMFLR